MKTVLNKQQIREICRAYENGEVKRTIYERYSISQKRLEEILKERKAVRKVVFLRIRRTSTVCITCVKSGMSQG